MSIDPCATWVNPVPPPPPWTFTVEPGPAVAYSCEAASTTGCMAVDPAAVILPATHVTAAAEAGADAGASLAGAALAGALVVAAADGAVLAPLLEQAPTANAAISASAPRRLGVE